MWLNNFNILLSFPYFFTTVFASSVKAPNANHLFNAIHSSTRQWGSSLNHNGMSFFVATVPARTQLYHGTSISEPIQGMEWLAFEPEHALIFAHPRRPRDHSTREGDEHGHDRKREDRRKTAGTEQTPSSPSPHHRQFSTSPPRRQSKDNQQQPLGPPSTGQDSHVGYLHTYAPIHDLHLLYVDGLSAGKTTNGTLDTQDMLILNMSSGSPHGPMGGEYERAKGMCDLASTIWEDKIDGILRMEAGFEIILCDFAKHLQRNGVVAVTEHDAGNGGRGFLGGWSYIRAVTQRYNGIGGERVRLDYDDFISVFAYPEIEGLFENDVQSDYIMPRLENVSEKDRLHIRNDLTSMILRKVWDSKTTSRNWQSIADMIIARYSSPLHYLHTNKQMRLDKEALEAYITLLLLPFIDSTSRNVTMETERCVAQFVPTTSSVSHRGVGLAHSTVHAIAHDICQTLLTSLSMISKPALHTLSTTVGASHAIELIDNLVDYLQWTTWKECGTCPDEQICYVPIWPMGSHEDHKSPQCRTEDEARGRFGYWGLGPRPRFVYGEDEYER